VKAEDNLIGCHIYLQTIYWFFKFHNWSSKLIEYDELIINVRIPVRETVKLEPINKNNLFTYVLLAKFCTVCFSKKI